MQDSIEKFISALPENIDAAIVLNASNRHYLFGVDTSDAGTLVVTHKKAYFIIDSRYIEICKRFENDKIEVVLQKDLFSQIKETCMRNSVRSVAIETQYVSLALYKKLDDFLGNIIDTSVDIGDILVRLRSVKTQYEIEKIKVAQKITDDAFKFILGEIGVGKSEKELALLLEFYMRSHGAKSASFDIIFIGGKNTSLPHGEPTDYKLQSGDLITIDFGADVDGYKSDMTRTVALGNVSNEQKKVYETVLFAQKTALNKISAGKSCKEIDFVARKVISDAGYGDYFGHALGHSVGLDIHESPNFSPKCNEVLKEGMILTVEPGIYLPEKYGVRIEDMVLITKNGAENLTKSPKSLIIL